MSEPTPIRKTKLRRSEHVKLSAVLAADMLGVVAASKQSGIPASSIEVWLHNPKYAEIRTRTREDLRDEVAAVAHLAWARVAETMPDMEPRDALFAADKASMMLQLLSGSATARTEHVTDGMNDHERETLKRVLSLVLTETVVVE